jgi:uncharacterized membrane protein YcaP (DUF421 family)
MMDWTWITTTGAAALMVVVTTVGIYAALLLFTRTAGLRSFSKLSSFDFAITVAMGSVVATVILSEDPPLVQGVVGLASLFAIQSLVAVLRNRFGRVRWAVDNTPLLLMAGSEVIPENLHAAQMTRDDLRAKLREANVIDRDHIRAVVMESTGDVSVLHAPSDGPDLDPDVLRGVDGTTHLWNGNTDRDRAENRM